jgi:putative OPT family oligopeptide transporter
MSEPDDEVPQKPPGTREFTPRAISAGLVVAVIMGAAYPYMVLKLGFGPNVSVVSAILGYLILGIAFRNFNRWENNIVQTAGTSAAQTAFMCVLLAAFDMLAQSPNLKFTFAPTPFQAFLWLTAASVLGLLLAVPLRRHFVVDEKLTYADGLAAGETIIILDSRGRQASDAALALLLGMLASALLWLLQQPQIAALFGQSEPLLIDTLTPSFFGLTYAAMNSGFSVSLLSIGSGMIVGNRVNISMGIGSIIAWVWVPHLLLESHRIADPPTRNAVLRWIMWPATGMLIAGGLTAMGLRWRVLARTFKNLSADAIRGGEFPLKWVGIGVALSTVALLVIQKEFFDVSIWLTLIAVICSLPLMLVGLRVLGETNWGPISQISNMMQALFAALVPGNLITNMAASGTTGTIATQSEAIMQDYKAGHMIGSTPRYLTYMQLIAAPIGAATVSYIYPVLKGTYGIGANGLTSPISVRWAGFTEFLAGGFATLPNETLMWFGIGAVVGILLTLLEQKWKKWTPSPTGLGIGMMVPGSIVLTMVVGGFLGWVWEKRSPKTSARLSIPLASGFIAGEAIVAVVLAIIVFALEQAK